MSDSQTLSFRPDVFQLDPPRLIGMRCGACASLSFPRRDSCPACGDEEELELRDLSSQGELCSWSVVRNAPAGLRTPYVLAYVDLDDEVRVMSRLVGVEPEHLAVGLPLALTPVPVASTRSPNPDADRGDEDGDTLMFAFTTRSEDLA